MVFMKSVLPLVSVVITTKNEEKHIVSCLKSIKNQDYPQKKIEIIVVDNHSTDDTVKLAKKYTQNVFTKGPERSAQRNYGMIIKSHGQYVMYIDADMELSKKVISSCVSRVTKNPDIIGLYIREIVTGDSYWSKVRRFERSFYEGTVIDCVRFIKKSAFVKVKGFDERLTGPEDWDLDKKIRQLGKVDLIKQPIYHNEAEFNLKKYLAKKSYYSKGLDIYIKKWSKDDSDVKKQFSPIYRLVVVFVEKGKWKVLLLRPHLTIGMVILRFAVGINYVISQKMNHKKILSKMWDSAMDLNKQNIIQMLEYNPKHNILDLGCDDGSWTIELAKKTGSSNLYGVDIVESSLNKARKLGIIAKKADINKKWPFKNNTFDCIHSNQVVEHIWDLDFFAKETQRTLKKNGYAIISTENLSSWVNIIALVFAWQPFSLTNISSKRLGIGNPFAIHRNKKHKFSSWLHTRVLTIRAIKEVFEEHGMIMDGVVGSGYFPLPAVIGKIEPFHSHFITLKMIKK